jgi:AAA15 family ATPase/GTPase
MLKSLKIENFRCFQSFELLDLGQINLLVGTNNSGKTSILEAIQLLTSPSILEPLWERMIARGEYIQGEETNAPREPNTRRELDIRHLFYGNEIDIGSEFSISGIRDKNGEDISNAEYIEVSIKEATPKFVVVSPKEKIPKNSQDVSPFLKVKQSMNKYSIELPLSYQWGLESPRYYNYMNRKKSLDMTTQFIPLSSLTNAKMIELFDEIVLNPEESSVVDALKIIEPSIERIAVKKNAFFVKTNNNNHQGGTPLGTMGDGVGRMLGIVLAIVNAKNGILLVDEIDTGLHFSIMSDMWKLVWETAKKLNVQVFATTHSSDCWTSLDAIASRENPSQEGITIHRIEKDKSRSIVFSEEEVAIAAEQGLEVR